MGSRDRAAGAVCSIRSSNPAPLGHVELQPLSRFGGTATRSVQLGGGALVHISGNIAGYRELSTGALLLAGA